MASGHVNRTNRPNTWLHRPATRREDFPCQPGAVHTWHKADSGRCLLISPLWGGKRTTKCSGRAFPLLTHSGNRDSIRGTGFMECSTADRPHSALMLAARITLPHFSVSSAMSFPNAADVIDIGSTPKPASRAFMRGSAATALISLLSLSITSAGVSFGAPTPYHWLAS